MSYPGGTFRLNEWGLPAPQEGGMPTMPNIDAGAAQPRRTNAWVLEVLSATGGTVPAVSMKATNGDHVEHFDVSLWPAGWRILRLGLTIPTVVRQAAIRLAIRGTRLGTAR